MTTYYAKSEEGTMVPLSFRVAIERERAELGPLTPEWCSCGYDGDEIVFRDDGDCTCGIHRHHYHCAQCGGLTQIG